MRERGEVWREDGRERGMDGKRERGREDRREKGMGEGGREGGTQIVVGSGKGSVCKYKGLLQL